MWTTVNTIKADVELPALTKIKPLIVELGRLAWSVRVCSTGLTPQECEV